MIGPWIGREREAAGRALCLAAALTFGLAGLACEDAPMAVDGGSATGALYKPGGGGGKPGGGDGGGGATLEFLATMGGGATPDFVAAAQPVSGGLKRTLLRTSGPGVGGRIGANLAYKGREVLSAFYWYQWLDTQNGSNLNGSDAYHNIQLIGLRGVVPIGSKFGIGADAYLFLRDSNFELFEDQNQRVPQLRIYGTWDTALDGGGRR